MGLKKCAIRIDSGDIAYLTKKARAYLDAQGLTDCKIIVSNALDEYLISELLAQEACIDGFGVGERLIKMCIRDSIVGKTELCVPAAFRYNDVGDRFFCFGKRGFILRRVLFSAGDESGGEQKQSRQKCGE